MFLRPDSVRAEKIPKECSKRVNWEDPELDFSRYSETGVIGDAGHASEQLGRELWEEIKKVVAEILREVAETPVRNSERC
jgi:creatinine amidohydrolase